MAIEHGRQPWPVRIRVGNEAVVGAGILLGNGQVLTCAHVVLDDAVSTCAAAVPTGPITVDLLGQPGAPSVPAQVVPGGWFPPADDGRGDIALLQLHQPPPGAGGAPLRRLSLSWRRDVYMLGFPKHLDDGVFVRATLAGPAGPGREWVQMDAAGSGLRLRAGFSGAAVVDERTGYVVGMVVSAYSDPQAGLSWMIPLETIISYLPTVAEWVLGDSSFDKGFTSFGPRPGDAETAGRIADFFSRDAPDNVMIIVTGHPDSAVAAALRRAVVLSSRALRPAPGAPGESVHRDARVPPVGSIDLALDVTGKSVPEVSRRIVEWMGVDGAATATARTGLVAEASPRTLVVDNIDESADPDSLVSDVVGPIVSRATEHDMRLLLGFRRPAVRLRLTMLERRIAQVQAAESAARQRYRHVAARVAGAPRIPARATDLRIRLTALRVAARHDHDHDHDHDRDPPTDRDRDRHLLHDQLACWEQVTDRALREVKAARDTLETLLSSRAELRGRLNAERARAVAAGLAEDGALGALYRQAHELLSAGPCELPVADASVQRYADTLRARITERAGRGNR